MNKWIVVSKYHSLLKEPGFLQEMADSKYKMNLDYLHLLAPENKKMLKNNGDKSKEHRNQLKRLQPVKSRKI